MQELKLAKTNDVLISGKAAEALIDLRSETALRLYIYLAQNGASLDAATAAARLGISQDALSEALDILVKKKLIATEEKAELAHEDEIPEYTVGDVAAAIEKDTSFSYLLDFTQKTLGKILSTVDTQTLLGIYNWMGLPVDVICLIITYCTTECMRKYGEGRRPTLRNIENQARLWLNLGIMTVAQAEEYLREQELRGTRTAQLAKLLHLTGRALSPTENRYIKSWIEAAHPDELILEAYDITVTKTGKLSWKYMDTILKSWNLKGFKSKKDVEKGERSTVKEKKNKVTKEQIDAFERIGELNKRWGSEK